MVCLFSLGKCASWGELQIETKNTNWTFLRVPLYKILDNTGIFWYFCFQGLQDLHPSTFEAKTFLKENTRISLPPTKFQRFHSNFLQSGKFSHFRAHISH